MDVRLSFLIEKVFIELVQQGGDVAALVFVQQSEDVMGSLLPELLVNDAQSVQEDGGLEDVSAGHLGQTFFEIVNALNGDRVLVPVV